MSNNILCRLSMNWMDDENAPNFTLLRGAPLATFEYEGFRFQILPAKTDTFRTIYRCFRVETGEEVTYDDEKSDLVDEYNDEIAKITTAEMETLITGPITFKAWEREYEVSLGKPVMKLSELLLELGEWLIKPATCKDIKDFRVGYHNAQVFERRYSKDVFNKNILYDNLIFADGFILDQQNRYCVHGWTT